MKIKFKAHDPRAGTVAQMDSSRGQQLIDAGAAEQVKDEDADAVVVSKSAESDGAAGQATGQATKAAKRGKKANAAESV